MYKPPANKLPRSETGPRLLVYTGKDIIRFYYDMTRRPAGLQWQKPLLSSTPRSKFRVSGSPGAKETLRSVWKKKRSRELRGLHQEDAGGLEGKLAFSSRLKKTDAGSRRGVCGPRTLRGAGHVSAELAISQFTLWSLVAISSSGKQASVSAVQSAPDRVLSRAETNRHVFYSEGLIMPEFYNFTP